MLTSNQIIAILTEKFGAKILAGFADNRYPRIHVNVENWREIAEFMLTDPRLKFDWLANHSGIDYVADDKMCVAHDLYSFDLKHTFAVKVYAPRSNPKFPTVCDLWPAADWHEREAYDLLGMIFEGHPDLRRILCSDDWVGFPLRKDYVFPREYHGIPGSVELDWQQRPDYPG